MKQNLYKGLLIGVLSCLMALEVPAVETAEYEPQDYEFVRVKDYIPNIHVELKYATTDNFTGTAIYDFTEAYLRYGTVKKLKEVQRNMNRMGLSLKIWDAYRPVYAQEKLWEVYPDPVYVANPENGITSHSRGDTVDITIVKEDGTEIEMPTGFDDFSELADRDYSDCTPDAQRNVEILEKIMYIYGFTGYQGEWWDFSDAEQYWDGMEFIPPAEEKEETEETAESYEETGESYEETYESYEETGESYEETYESYEETGESYEETYESYEETGYSYEETE